MVRKSPFERLSKDQLIEKLEEELWAAARPRVAQRLGAIVMAQLGINPQGVDLVMWLADGRHRSNATAMTQWVENQMNDPTFNGECSHTDPPLVLARRIVKHLHQREAANQ